MGFDDDGLGYIDENTETDGHATAEEEMACTESFAWDADQPLSEAAPDRETCAPEKPAAFYRESVRNESAAIQLARLRRITSLVLLAALIGGLTLGLGIGVGSQLAIEFLIPQLSSGREDMRDFSVRVGQLSAELPPAIGLTYADVIGMVEPAVVRVMAIRSAQGPHLGATAQSTGHGTGMIFYETANRYYIATNAHVVSEAVDFFISIEGSSPIRAELVGLDDDADVAVMSVSRANVIRAGIRNVSLVEFGNSDMLRTGDSVVAIGNALGDGISSTNGIISALNRTISIEGVHHTVLQTNAAINHGNSGGPLVSMHGEVIGMNTAKLKRNDVEGMGYSIPSNEMIPVIEAIMRGERPVPPPVGQPRIGIYASDANGRGAMILYVFEGSAAYAAGLVAGDIITALNGRPVIDHPGLLNAIARYRVGDEVVVTVLRDGRRREISLTLMSDLDLPDRTEE